ncbi:MCM6 [Ecytonucleospora hepatopenaei]|uniref:DNA replication licensing factor MCM6 n=1 Tax=Ecytonucleospora hepatopenaei TaxID=646526 RepID=A0A1W0E7R4_9MICR|nr:MCM6 [Ecytonucleospora hepatopenaei]
MSIAVTDIFYNFLNNDSMLTEIENVLLQNGQTFYVDLGKLNAFDSALSMEIQQHFTSTYDTLKSIFETFCTEKFDRKLDLSFTNNLIKMKIRDIKSHVLNKLISFTGTVTRTTQVRPELTKANFQCRICKAMICNVEQECRYTEPIFCPNQLCTNRTLFDLQTEQSQFSNWQRICVQESTEEIPKGSLPRNMDVIVRNELCEQIKPGSHLTFTGYAVVVDSDINYKMPNNTLITQLQGEGDIQKKKSSNLKEMNFKLNFICVSVSNNKTNSEDNQNVLNNFNIFDNNMQHLDVYNKFSEALFPTIYGHANIKNAILLMLVGGCSKNEDIKLRGDINILLVGDPGTAKSQFLKQTSALMDRCIYTSGKSSSAAGLTAAVARDETGEYTIDAGALMLSDNGVCCIDEFDKMTYKDQVSIHEAMEQQTVSISKAGINATLNARCSVLAAANPIKGRYDSKRTLKANVNMSPAIMSRFDLYFVLIDKIDKNNDALISKYILDVHSDSLNNNTMEYTSSDVIKYIKQIKNNRPIITEEAKDALESKYIALRQECLINTNNYKMTVRHLESMVRLSEALAKLHNTDVYVTHVNEAYRLLKSSLVEIEQSEVMLFNSEINQEANKITMKEYNAMVNAMVYIIKQNDYDREEVVLAYCKAVEDKIESEEELNEIKRKAGEVLRLLIENEGILYEEEIVYNDNIISNNIINDNIISNNIINDNIISNNIRKIIRIHEAYDI